MNSILDSKSSAIRFHQNWIALPKSAKYTAHSAGCARAGEAANSPARRLVGESIWKRFFHAILTLFTVRQSPTDRALFALDKQPDTVSGQWGRGMWLPKESPGARRPPPAAASWQSPRIPPKQRVPLLAGLSHTQISAHRQEPNWAWTVWTTNLFPLRSVAQCRPTSAEQSTCRYHVLNWPLPHRAERKQAPIREVSALTTSPAYWEDTAYLNSKKESKNCIWVFSLL